MLESLFRNAGLYAESEETLEERMEIAKQQRNKSLLVLLITVFSTGIWWFLGTELLIAILVTIAALIAIYKSQRNVVAINSDICKRNEAEQAKAEAEQAKAKAEAAEAEAKAKQKEFEDRIYAMVDSRLAEKLGD